MTDQQILSAALLWLRNHYEVGNHDLREIVLARIDAVLEKHPASGKAAAEFRKLFPVKAHIKDASK